MNFSLMYFLAGTPASASRAGGNIVAKLFDENTLKGMGAPGALPPPPLPPPTAHLSRLGVSVPAPLQHVEWCGMCRITPHSLSRLPAPTTSLL